MRRVLHKYVAAWQCTTLAKVLLCKLRNSAKPAVTTLTFSYFYCVICAAFSAIVFFHCGNYGCETQCFFTCASFAQNIFAQWAIDRRDGIVVRASP